LANDETVEFRDDLARGEVGHAAYPWFHSADVTIVADKAKGGGVRVDGLYIR
jgi:hypothetical protein